ncbi:MAG TPA: haloacid dehalogenase type II [Trebonia sp.]
MTGLPVRAVLFDVFGTVVDWRSGIAAAVGVFADRHGLELDPGAFADAWRGQYQPAMRRVRSGMRPYVSLDVLHRENLDDVLRGLGLDPAAFGPGELDTLTRAWHFLPPWPDTVAGIAAVRRGYVTGPLSNGNTSLLVDMAKAAGLPWDVILGSDVSRAYKPSPEAYLRPAALLGLRPGEVMLAAAHESDLAAAREAGLATAYIDRPFEHGPEARPAGTSPAAGTGGPAGWDLTGTTVPAIAAQL